MALAPRARRLTCPCLRRSPRTADCRRWLCCTASATPSRDGCSCCSWDSWQVAHVTPVASPQHPHQRRLRCLLLDGPDLIFVCRRRSGRRHRHRGPLADGHEGRDLPRRLLVQPRALLLEVQRDHLPGQGPLSAVADLGGAHNGHVRGRDATSFKSKMELIRAKSTSVLLKRRFGSI